MQSFIRAYSRGPMSRTLLPWEGYLCVLIFIFRCLCFIICFLVFSYYFLLFSSSFRVPPLLCDILFFLEGPCVLIMLPCGQTPTVQPIAAYRYTCSACADAGASISDVASTRHTNTSVWHLFIQSCNRLLEPTVEARCQGPSSLDKGTFVFLYFKI